MATAKLEAQRAIDRNDAAAASNAWARATRIAETVGQKTDRLQALMQCVSLEMSAKRWISLLQASLEVEALTQATPAVARALSSQAEALAALGGKCRCGGHPLKRPLLIATEYEHLADEWALRHNLAHITIQTWGSTEAFAPEDADIVFDCMETGRTLDANGLVIIDRIMSSSTWLVANRRSLESMRSEIDALKGRL